MARHFQAVFDAYGGERLSASFRTAAWFVIAFVSAAGSAQSTLTEQILALYPQVEPDRYAAKADSYLSALGGFEGLMAPGTPTAGRSILGLLKGDKADRLGLRVGEVITHLDGRSGRITHEDIHAKESRRFRIFGLDGQVRTIDAPSGGLGCWTADYWNPLAWYLRDGQRDAAWDRHVCVGVHAVWRDPGLSAAAWRLAFDAGAVESVTWYQVGAGLAMQKLRWDLAIRCLAQIEEVFDNPILAIPEEYRGVIASEFYTRVGLADQRERFDFFPGVFGDEPVLGLLNHLLDKQEAVRQVDRVGVMPVVTDLFSSWSMWGFGNDSGFATALVGRERPVVMTVPGRWHTAVLGLPAGWRLDDYELSVHFRLKAIAEPSLRRGPNFQVVVRDRELARLSGEKAKPGLHRVMNVHLLDRRVPTRVSDGPRAPVEVWVTGGVSDAELRSPAVGSVRFDGQQAIHVQLVRRGETGTIFMNGVCLAAFDLGLKYRQPFFEIGINSMRVEIDEFEVRGITNYPGGALATDL